jgi:hypothetical protein
MWWKALEKDRKRMSIEEIKNLLPNVQVKMRNGKVIVGTLRGRKLRFAVVRVDEDIVLEYAWETIQHSINSNTPLLT